MSVTWPWVPAEGWWIITSALGKAIRFPLVPAASRKAPMEAAMPTQMVATSHFTYCMVSKMAMPAVTLPPGLLM